MSNSSRFYVKRSEIRKRHAARMRAVAVDRDGTSSQGDIASQDLEQDSSSEQKRTTTLLDEILSGIGYLIVIIVVVLALRKVKRDYFTPSDEPSPSSHYTQVASSQSTSDDSSPFSKPSHEKNGIFARNLKHSSRNLNDLLKDHAEPASHEDDGGSVSSISSSDQSNNSQEINRPGHSENSEDAEGDSEFSPNDLPQSATLKMGSLSEVPEYSAQLEDVMDRDKKIAELGRYHASKGHRRWCQGYVDYLQAGNERMDFLLKNSKANRAFWHDINQLGIDNIPNRFR